MKKWDYCKYMATIFLQKRGRYLEPADQSSEEIVKKLPATKALKCKFSVVRNLSFHKKGMVLFQTMFDMQEHFDAFDPFRKWLTAKAGFCKIYTAPNGYTLFEAESLAFDSMDDLRFQQVYNAVIDTFIAEFPSISKQQLTEILEFAE